MLALSRQDLVPVRRDADTNRCAHGAYRLKAAEAARRAVIIATGSEVGLALGVAAALEAQGLGTDVVSMPCTQLFDAQDAAYRADLLPEGVLRISIEAGTTFGWERYTGLDGMRFGIDRFGASAPGKVLMAHFGFSVDAIVPQIASRLNI